MDMINDLNLKTKLVISDKEYDFELHTIIEGSVKEIKFDNKIYYVENYNEPPKNKIPSEALSVMKHDTKQDIEQDTKQDTKDLPSKTPVKHKKKKPDNNRIFSEQDFICKVNSVRIYQSMTDYLTRTLPERNISRIDIASAISRYYRDVLHRSLGDKTLDNYAGAYAYHMSSNNILKRLNRSEYVWIKHDTKQDTKDLSSKTLEKPIDKTPGDPEGPIVTVTKSPTDVDLAEFTQWLKAWENNTFTKGDVRRCTTLSAKKIERMLEDQLKKGLIKEVSDYEYAKVTLLDRDKSALDGANRVLDGTG